MKKTLGTIIFFVLASVAIAQSSVSGIVTDSEQKPLEGATVLLQLNEKKVATFISLSDGSFRFENLNPQNEYRLVVQFVGKKVFSENFNAGEKVSFQIALANLDYFLEPLEVKSIRAADRAPFTKTDISKTQLSLLNVGQDIPVMLNQTLSVTITSDAGNGIGYTGIRIRGTDATRINVTLNGIPYNDAESQGTYFVDLPDLSSSVSSIQIQRGVGTSTNGSGAFGATINFSTNEFNERPYTEVNNSYGSFRSWKNTIKAGSGLLSNHFTVDARLSRITSDGYIDRAATSLQSLYFSAAYLNKQTSLRFNLITGKEKTYQAWYGLPEALLHTDRTYNAAGTEKPGEPYNNQTDNYQQDHYQLFFNQNISSNWKMNITSFLTRGKGYYEEYKAEQSYSEYGLNDVIIGGDTISTTDLVRQRWLDNYFYGQLYSFEFKKAKHLVTVGGAWTKYEGKHFGNIIYAQNGGVANNYKYYNYPATKTDWNVYAKWLYQINNNWNLFADVQLRNVMHNMQGFEGTPDLFIKRNFTFFNPKAGFSYFGKNGWHASFSYALAHREPNRDDFQAAMTEQPTYETLHDFEATIEKKNTKYNFSATYYYMYYNNQLVLTGKINDVGSYTRTNVPNSYRTGVELQAGYVFSKWVSVAGNLTLSSNKIKSFTEYIDDYDAGKQQVVQHNNTDISFSPNIISSVAINFIPAKNFEISCPAKFVGKQYLDNTQNDQRSLQQYFTQDVRLHYKLNDFIFSEWNFILQVNNVFNKQYEPNGYTYPYYYGGELINDNYYYPMAGTNFMLAVNVRL